MTSLIDLVLTKIFAKLVQQGPRHASNVEQVFRILRAAWEKEFTEDNRASQHAHLQELFDQSKTIQE